MVEPIVVVLIGGGVGSGFGLAVWRRSIELSGLRPRRVAAVVSLVAVTLGSVIASPTVAVAAPLVSGLAAAEVERRRRQDLLWRRSIGLPVVIDHMIQQLRSGMGLRAVCARPVAVSGEVDRALRPLVDSLRADRALGDSVERLQAEAFRQGWFDVQLLAATLAALVDRGGPAVPALVRLRLTLMGSVEARSRARAQAGQAHASAALLAGAPALFAVTVALADADVGHLYLHEPIGAVCVVLALAISHLGWRWMRRDVDRALGSCLGAPRRRSGSSP